MHFETADVECTHENVSQDAYSRACSDCGIGLGARYAVRTRGRPSRLTPELTANICDWIRRGAYMHVGAMACGISPAALYNWLRGTKPAHRTFQEAVNQARGEARALAETQIHAEKPDVWLLRGPGRDTGDTALPGWVSDHKVNISGTVKVVRQYDLKKLSDAELEALDGITSRALLTDGAIDAEFEEGEGEAVEVEADGAEG